MQPHALAESGLVFLSGKACQGGEKIKDFLNVTFLCVFNKGHSKNFVVRVCVIEDEFIKVVLSQTLCCSCRISFMKIIHVLSHKTSNILLRFFSINDDEVIVVAESRLAD